MLSTNAWVAIRVKKFEPLEVVDVRTGNTVDVGSCQCMFPAEEQSLPEFERPHVHYVDGQCAVDGGTSVPIPRSAKCFVVAHSTHLPARLMREIYTPGMVAAFQADTAGNMASVANQLNGFEAKDFYTLRGSFADELVSCWNARLFDDANSLNEWRRVTHGVCGGYEHAQGDKPPRTHTAWNWAMSAIMYFLASKIVASIPPGATVMDVCMGGGGRALMACWLGYDFFGCDIRQGVVDGVSELYRQSLPQLQGRATFVRCDARNVITEARVPLQRHLGKIWFVLGSWEFWKAECSNGGVDKDQPYMSASLERCQTYEHFLDSTKQMLMQCVCCVNPGGVIMLHMPGRIHCPKTKVDHNWIQDLSSYGKNYLGLDTSHRHVAFVNALGNAPMHAVKTFGKRRRLQPQVEYVIIFKKQGYVTPPIQLPGTTKRGVRRVVDEEAVLQQRASFDPLVGVGPNAMIQVRDFDFERGRKKGGWQPAIQLRDMSTSRGSLTQATYGLSWRFEFRKDATNRLKLSLAPTRTGGRPMESEPVGSEPVESELMESELMESEVDTATMESEPVGSELMESEVDTATRVDWQSRLHVREDDGSTKGIHSEAQVLLEALPNNNLENIQAHIVDEHTTTLATYDGRQIVGVAIVDERQTPARITALGVKKSYQHQGCGVHLMDVIKSRVQSLVVEADEVAINWYIHHGFTFEDSAMRVSSEYEELTNAQRSLVWARRRRTLRQRLTVQEAREAEVHATQARGAAQHAYETMSQCRGIDFHKQKVPYRFPGDICGIMKCRLRAQHSAQQHGGGVVYKLRDYHWVFLCNQWYVDEHWRCAVQDHDYCAHFLKEMSSEVEELSEDGQVV